jgi:hypothetical protein
MKGRNVLRQSAIVARIFRIDPLVVLDERDPMRIAARIAAVEYVVEMEADAQRRAQQRR